MCLIPPLLTGMGLLAPLGKCNCRAGKGCCYFVLSPSGQGGGMDGAGVTRGGFFPRLPSETSGV